MISQSTSRFFGKFYTFVNYRLFTTHISPIREGSLPILLLSVDFPEKFEKNRWFLVQEFQQSIGPDTAKNNDEC